MLVFNYLIFFVVINYFIIMVLLVLKMMLVKFDYFISFVKFVKIIILKGFFLKFNDWRYLLVFEVFLFVNLLGIWCFNCE